MVLRKLIPNDPLIGQFLRLFHDSFEEDTRETDEQILDEIAGDHHQPITIEIAEQEGQLIALQRWISFGEAGFSWLIHIAVHPETQGQGTGSQMLQDLIDRLGHPLFVEVEPGHLRAWYEKFGFQVVTENYWQPALHPHTQPVPLLLMSNHKPMKRRQAIEDFYRFAWHGLDHDQLLKRALVGSGSGESVG